MRHFDEKNASKRFDDGEGGGGKLERLYEANAFARLLRWCFSPSRNRNDYVKTNKLKVGGRGASFE